MIPAAAVHGDRAGRLAAGMQEEHVSRGFEGRRARRAIRAIMAVTAIGAAIAVGAPAASAAELSGVHFDDALRLGGSDLRLNGVGLRSVFILKAYVAGLYVPQVSRDAADLIAQQGPRRFEMRMLIEMSAARLLKAFNEGLQGNLPEAQFAALKPQIDQLAATLHALGTARKGDVVDIDLVDGATQLSLNGQPKGEPIPGEEFYAALLRVFLGPRPADKDLKKGLLGG
jgi:hypothetical protein